MQPVHPPGYPQTLCWVKSPEHGGEMPYCSWKGKTVQGRILSVVRLYFLQKHHHWRRLPNRNVRCRQNWIARTRSANMRYCFLNDHSPDSVVSDDIAAQNTGFVCRIKRSCREVFPICFHCFANRLYFGMEGGVLLGFSCLDTLSNDFVAQYNDRADRRLPPFCCNGCQCFTAFHKMVILFRCHARVVLFSG